jgi:uncharacterized protein (DUF58 family)
LAGKLFFLAAFLVGNFFFLATFSWLDNFFFLATFSGLTISDNVRRGGRVTVILSNSNSVGENFKFKFALAMRSGGDYRWRKFQIQIRLATTFKFEFALAMKSGGDYRWRKFQIALSCRVNYSPPDVLFCRLRMFCSVVFGCSVLLKVHRLRTSLGGGSGNFHEG